MSRAILDLSVVIVNWNTCEHLSRCLESLGDHKDPVRAGTATKEPLVHVEVFVVDNASTDGSQAMVREQFPWVRFIENSENLGFAAANNQALRQATGRYQLLLNSDCEVRPGALQSLVAFMDAHPRAGAAGARLLNTDGSLQPSCLPMLTPSREFWRLAFLDRIWPRATYPMLHWDISAPRQVEVIKGACLQLRRQALAEIGLLDEEFFMYTEEVDLCFRLAQADWQLWWVPTSEIVHHEAQSTRQAAEEMYIQLYRSKAQFYRKVGGPARARHFRRLVRLAYLPRYILARLGGLVSPNLSIQATTYRRLLDTLSEI